MKIQAAAEVPVDVLFTAFENFICGIWREQVGPVLGAQMLVNLQNHCCQYIIGPGFVCPH